MRPYYEREGIRLYVGDCRKVAADLPAESISAVVTDPPYGLTSGKRGGTGEASLNPNSPAGRSRIGTGGGFMGQQWDASGIERDPDFWAVVGRLLTPGAHLLAFGGTRTFYRIAVAIEDAGFEVRDTLMWLFGSGFPKSLDVSKAIDKAAGAEREVVGARDRYRDGGKRNSLGNANNWGGTFGTNGIDAITAPATDAARQWDGWGTALKPAYEPVILARKPLSGTVAATVLAHGTGALNIDASRIGTETRTNGGMSSLGVMHDDNWQPGEVSTTVMGRWPSNVLLDPEAAAALDRMSGERKSGKMKPTHTTAQRAVYGQNANGGYTTMETYGDTGGASRFFPVLPVDDPDTLRMIYSPKASRAERNAGLDGLPEREKDSAYGNGLNSATKVRTEKQAVNGVDRGMTQNHHPTVKPLALMRWLLTLVTPPGGVVFEPFAGSGTTLVACAQLGIAAIGAELSEEYAEIAARRIDHALDERAKRPAQSVLTLGDIA